MALGPLGEALIKKYDSKNQSGLPHLVAYQDSGKVWTIGWGHTGSDVYEGLTITTNQANAFFQKDLVDAKRAVDKYISTDITQLQKDALISFTYNAGSGSLYKSQIRKLINQNRHDEAVIAWRSQNIKNNLGVVQSGLIARRIEESELYARGITENQLKQKSTDELSEPVDQKTIDSSSNIIPYTHSSGESTTSIEELLKSKRFITSGITKQDFLNFKHNGKTNHVRLYEGLDQDQKKQFGQVPQYNPIANYPIADGTVIYISADKVSIDASYQSNITVQNTKLVNNFPAIIKTLTNDPGYIPAYKRSNNQHRDIYPRATVLIWSRTLYLQQNKVGGFIDVSKDIMTVNTQSSMDIGGNFSITLPFISTEINKDNEWEPKNRISDTVALSNINSRAKVIGDIYESIRTGSYYSNIIQQNDMVFISFEQLQLEDSELDFEVIIKNKWFDLIGLVDGVEDSTIGSTTNYNVTIRGRDFIKALMDDNSYFNPYSIGHVNSLFGESFGQNERYLSGEFKTISAFLPKTIEGTVKFIIHRIASIGYVPDNVFDIFENTTEITQTIKGTNSNIEVNEKKPVTGIWRICKLFIDQSIQDLRVVDDSVSNPQGTIFELLNKIAQNPFVEFFADTYKDKFYLFFRQPPFTEQSVGDAVIGFDESNQYDEVSQIEQQQEPTQSKVEQQKVFAEREDNEEVDISILNQLSEVTPADTRYPIVVNISEVDVRSDTLVYSNEAYAWYQIEQRGNFAGNTVTLGQTPALYFDTFAQVFGNRRLNVVSNYSDYRFFEYKDGSKQRDLYAEQASQQLAYLVETNIYLPFTRQGSITINGDRRIKKGNWIYFRPTNEMFYVNDVSHNLIINETSIERSTTIQVERGMIKDYIVGKTENIAGNQVEVSYFNIVDIVRLRNGVYDTVTKGSADSKFDHKSNILINEDVFSFLLQKRQNAKL